VNSGEVSRGIPEAEKAAAYDFCEYIRHAAELTEQAKRLELIAQRAGSNVIQKSMFGNLPFVLSIDIPSSTEAFTVRDDDVIEEQPAGFVATEIRSVSEHGVEFYNRNTEIWLKLKGFEFEVFPVFDEQQPDTGGMAEDLLDAARESSKGLDHSDDLA